MKDIRRVGMLRRLPAKLRYSAAMIFAMLMPDISLPCSMLFDAVDAIHTTRRRYQGQPSTPATTCCRCRHSVCAAFSYRPFHERLLSADTFIAACYAKDVTRHATPYAFQPRVDAAGCCSRFDTLSPCRRLMLRAMARFRFTLRCCLFRRRRCHMPPEIFRCFRCCHYAADTLRAMLRAIFFACPPLLRLY